MPDPNAPDPADLENTTEELYAALANLPVQHRQVLELRFGFDDGKVRFGACYVDDASGRYGSASAFLPQ